MTHCISLFCIASAHAGFDFLLINSVGGILMMAPPAMLVLVPNIIVWLGHEAVSVFKVYYCGCSNYFLAFLYGRFQKIIECLGLFM
jgi:hypothetical protein